MQVLSHHDIAPERNPTGEALLDRSTLPCSFWIPSGKVLVLGHSQEVEREIQVEAATRDGIAVHRRMGGGGAVLLSPACVCVGLRFLRVKGRSLHEYFEAGSDLIRRAVRQATGLDLESRGISDLAYPSPAGLRKVVGCSLYMPRDFALYLASILVDSDLGDIATYLTHPTREPDYRAGRSHGEFIAGLSTLAPRPVTPEDLLKPLASVLEDGLKTPLDWPAG